MSYFVIGADIVPTEENLLYFKSGEIDRLLGAKLRQTLAEASYRIFNLETPLTDTVSPIEKCGPCLCAPTEAIQAYRNMGIDLVTLANNHIMDQGASGLEQTIRTLDKADICHVGAGAAVDEAAKPFYFTFDGKRVGVYACAEHEFSIATEEHPGANPLDPFDTPDHIAAAKKQCDFLIVLLHGGKEHYRYLSPMMQKASHKLIEKGADLVVFQHTHCVGCFEKYQNGTIVYGQGNFLFGNSVRETWKTGLLIKISDDFSVSYVPLHVSENGAAVEEETGENNETLRSFYARSNEILSPGVIESKYAELAEREFEHYLKSFCGRDPLLVKVLNKVSGNRIRKRMYRKKYTKNVLLHLYDYISCEAHRELVSKGMEKRWHE